MVEALNCSEFERRETAQSKERGGGHGRGHGDKLKQFDPGESAQSKEEGEGLSGGRGGNVQRVDAGEPALGKEGEDNTALVELPTSKGKETSSE